MAAEAGQSGRRGHEDLGGDVLRLLDSLRSLQDVPEHVLQVQLEQRRGRQIFRAVHPVERFHGSRVPVVRGEGLCLEEGHPLPLWSSGGAVAPIHEVARGRKN